MAEPEETSALSTPTIELIESKDSSAHINVAMPPAKFLKKDFVEKQIIHPGMKDVDTLNAFRELRTSILPKLKQSNSIIQVSALRQGGGASFSALNLAVACTFDQHGHALLVDCNLERPSLAQALNVEVELGLNDFLTQKTSDVGDIIYPTGISRLSLVPSGRVDEEDSIEFFTGEKMRLFLEDVKNRYQDRIIIIDAPPILESADAKILAEVVDNVLLVLPYSGATASKIQKMLKAAGKDKVVGFVLNN